MDHNSEEEAAPAAEANSSGKFVVKLKIPPPPENQEKSHFCKECNKGFTSGKALGGHMSSAHVQANKDYSDKKLVKKNHHRRISGAAAQPTCNICGRPFKSEKSLFGHMRCHPERCYRGMDPPEPESSSEEDSGGSAVAPPPPDLKSWPVGVKRGRGPMGVFMRGPGEDNENENDNALASVHEIVRIVGNEPKRRNLGGKVDESNSDESSEGVKTAAEILAEMGGGDVKVEKLHTCDLCNASFYSYQALGGHRSSHKKIKLSIVNKADELMQSKTLVDGRGGGSGDSSRVRREKVVVGFDLNLMPEDGDEEEEEEEDGSIQS